MNKLSAKIVHFMYDSTAAYKAVALLPCSDVSRGLSPSDYNVTPTEDLTTDYSFKHLSRNCITHFTIYETLM